MKISIKRFVLISAATIFILSSGLVLGNVVFAEQATNQTPEQQLKTGPWLLEYGFAGSVGEWDYAVDLMISEGIEPDEIYVPDSIPPIGLPFTRALRLAEYINDNNLEDVRIIGHSQGGIDAAYMIELGYILDDNKVIPDYMGISQGGILSTQKQEFITAYKKVKAIYTLHSPFMRSWIRYRHVANLVEEFINYGSGRYDNGCCDSLLCCFLRDPNDGMLWAENMFLYSNSKIIHKKWIDSGICHSEARLVPDYILDIIY